MLTLPHFFCTPPPPPPSAFDDLSQAHGGEYSKGGYGGSAQSQAKSAGSGPGKGTHTPHVRTLQQHTVSKVSSEEKTDILTFANGSIVKCFGERCVFAHVLLQFNVHINGNMSNDEKE